MVNIKFMEWRIEPVRADNSVAGNLGFDSATRCECDYRQRELTLNMTAPGILLLVRSVNSDFQYRVWSLPRNTRHNQNVEIAETQNQNAVRRALGSRDTCRRTQLTRRPNESLGQGVLCRAPYDFAVGIVAVHLQWGVTHHNAQTWCSKPSITLPCQYQNLNNLNAQSAWEEISLHWNAKRKYNTAGRKFHKICGMDRFTYISSIID